MVPTPNQLALFRQGQPLVRSIALAAMRRLPVHVELDDLIGYGQLGLAEAVMHYQQGLNTRFTTYAYYRIKGAIYDGVSKMSWTSRGRLNRLRFRHGGDDASQASQSANDKFAASLIRVYSASQIESELEHAGDDPADDSAWSPLAQAVRREISRRLRELVSSLPRMPRILIESIYFDGMTLQDAAVRVGISKSWASRLHAQTLQQLGLALRRIGVD